ncbi:MAG: membrane dipeptidase [Fervidicoccaceae archaeon]
MRRPPIIDLHEDLCLYYSSPQAEGAELDLSVDSSGREADLPKYARANVRLVFASVTTLFRTLSTKYNEKRQVLVPRASKELLFEHLSIYYRLSRLYGMEIVKTSRDAERLLHFPEARPPGLLLHLEGADALDSPYDLEILHGAGVRSLGLQWNHDNKYGSGCFSRRDRGLTGEGEELVAEANRLGVIIDVAHSSKKTALEVLEVSRRPVIISHANVRAIVDSPRNVDDEVLEALSSRGGVIGVSLIDSMVKPGGRSTVDDVIKHFVYIYERFGPDVLAIGTDYFGLRRAEIPRGLETVDSLPLLFERLAEAGLKDSDLEKVAYGNALRVIRENLG